MHSSSALTIQVNGMEDEHSNDKAIDKCVLIDGNRVVTY